MGILTKDCMVPRGIQNFKEEREPRPLVKLTEVAFAVPPFPHGSSTTKSQREKKTPRLQLHSTSYVGITEKLLDPVRQSWLFKKPSSPQGNKQLIFLTQPVLRPTIQPWFAVGLLSKFNHNRVQCCLLQTYFCQLPSCLWVAWLWAAWLWVAWL